MNNKKLIQFAQSFLFLPIIATPVSFGNLPNSGTPIVSTSQVVLSQKLNIGVTDLMALNQVVDQKAKDLKAKADAIDAYLKEHDMPIAGLGEEMVLAAEKNDLDWRLLPAIAVRESTGGKQDCKNVDHNFFGWGSCHIGFKSDEEAINIVAKNLGGNNPSTARHYADKDTKQILDTYNPPYVVHNYTKQVMHIMDTIDNYLVVTPDMNNNNA